VVFPRIMQALGEHTIESLLGDLPDPGPTPSSQLFPFVREQETSTHDESA